MARPHLGPRPSIARELNRADAHDDLLFELIGSCNGLSGHLLDALEQDLADIDRDGDLSETGRAKKKAALFARYADHEDIARYRVKHARAEKTAEELFAKLTKRSAVKLTATDPDERQAELLRRELRDDRIARDYRALAPEAKRRAFYDACAKVGTSETARNLLHSLMDDGLLSDAETERAKDSLMQGAHPEAYRQYLELAGNGSATAPGLLNIAKYTLERFTEHLRAVTAAPMTLDAMAESRGFAKAIVTDKAIVLDRTAAHDVEYYRTAQAQAKAEGKELRIEAPEADGPPS
jgi:hypothetical protein